jgi:hypothetical protein
MTLVFLVCIQIPGVGVALWVGLLAQMVQGPESRAAADPSHDDRRCILLSSSRKSTEPRPLSARPEPQPGATHERGGACRRGTCGSVTSPRPALRTRSYRREPRRFEVGRRIDTAARALPRLARELPADGALRER